MRLKRMRRQWTLNQTRPAQAVHKDIDARWTLETGREPSDAERSGLAETTIPTSGYKVHASIDRRFRSIRCWDVANTGRYDGRLLREGFLDPTSTGAGVCVANGEPLADVR